MRHSESLEKIAPALIAAQKAMPVVHKTAVNPHFKSTFAPLGAIVDAALPVLHANGIALLQGGGPSDDGSIEVVTRLQHNSGEWVQSAFRLPLGKSDPQGAGSAITYGKRYGLAAMLGIVADDDDDAESTMGRVTSNAQPVLAAAHQRVLPPKEEVPRPRSVIAGAIPEVCPKCGGPVWDNRENKKNPKGPDWTCKDKECKTGNFVTAGWAEKTGAKLTKSEGAGPGMERDVPPPEEESDDVPW